MKSDLDGLMQTKNLDALIVLGNAEKNPPMYYLTGGGHVSDALLIKKRGEIAALYCNAMEREEAAKSGLRVIPTPVGALGELLNDPKKIFADQNIHTGRVGVYGTLDVSVTIRLIDALRAALPDIEFISEMPHESLFMYAMETKDEAEVERVRRMGRATVEVVGLVAEFLTGQEVNAREELIQSNGAPLTIQDVKNKIARWLAERGAADVEGCIFALGRDAGFPHSVGNPQDILKLGQTIVFDIFPAEENGGYFYDFTRTWSLGYATPEAQSLHDEVKAVYDKVIENLDVNADFREYQKLTCDEFAKRGHKTPMHNEGILTEGYVHSLGHGLGLNVHERPGSRHTAADDNRLKPGVVFTIEPGLYYPERGMGFRIEDSYWMRPDGKAELLAEYPYDFVLPMKKWKKNS